MACSSFTRSDSFPGLVGEPIRRRLVAVRQSTRQNRKLPLIDDLLVLHDCHLAASRLVQSVTAMKRVLYVQPDGILRQIRPAEGLAATSDHNGCAIARDFIVVPHGGVAIGIRVFLHIPAKRSNPPKRSFP